MEERQDNPVGVRTYVDVRFNDLLNKHEGDLRFIQEEINRRIETVRREMDLRFEQIEDRLSNLIEIREMMRQQSGEMVSSEVFSSKIEVIDRRLSRIDAVIERQRGRMAAYAAISGVLLLVLAIVTLVLDHVKLLPRLPEEEASLEFHEPVNRRNRFCP